MKKKAFTLIELLVVMVVVGILIALITPAISGAMQNAKRAQCANNLRQIGVATLMYVDEHEFKFPLYMIGLYQNYWYENIGPYIDDNEIFRDPGYKWHEYGTYSKFSYAYNAYLGNIDLNNIISPSQCMMVTDGYEPPGSGCDNEPYYSYFFLEKQRGIGPSARHKGGANIVFVDGHVGWHRASSIPYDNSNEAKLWWNY